MPPKNKNLMSDMVPARKPVERPVSAAPREPEREEVVRSRSMPVDTGSGMSASSAILWLVVAAAFIGLVLAIGGLFTGATLSIQRKDVSGAVDMNVTFSKAAAQGSVFVATATRTFRALEVVASTGTSGVDAAASGTVRAFNASPSRKTLPKGTVIVSTNGTAYLTDKAATVPAAAKEQSGQADIPVRAREVGARGNIDLDDFTFENPAASLEGVTVKSLTAMTGGTSSADATADPVAVSAARDRVVARVADRQALVRRMSEELPEDMIMLPLDLPSGEPTVTVEPGFSDGVHVSAVQTVAILMTRRADIAQKLGSSLSQEEGRLTLESFEGLTVAAPVALSDAAASQSFQARVAGQATLKGLIDADALERRILGQSRRTVREILRDMPEVSSFSLSMTPPWRRTLPIDPLAIDLVLR